MSKNYNNYETINLINDDNNIIKGVIIDLTTITDLEEADSNNNKINNIKDIDNNIIKIEININNIENYNL